MFYIKITFQIARSTQLLNNLVKWQILIQHGCARAWNSAFLTSSQGILMVLIWNHIWSNVKILNTVEQYK